MDIFNVAIGDKIGAISGPGQHPTDFICTVEEKNENKWGKYLIVRLPNGTTDTVHSFTNKGIGWYYLG